MNNFRKEKNNATNMAEEKKIINSYANKYKKSDEKD